MRMRLNLSVLVLALALPTVVQAASIQGPRRSALEQLEEGDAIRKRVQYRGGRFELAPRIGFTMNDAYRRNFLYGLGLGYHMTDSLALGLTVFGGLGYDSALAERISTEREDKTDRGAFSEVVFLGALELTYTPVIGKFALFGRSVFNYDLNVTIGVGAASVGGSTDVEEVSIAPVAAVGMRAFITDWGAVIVDVRDYIYSSALNAVPNTDDEASKGNDSSSEFRNNFMVTLGFGFFFPTLPEIGD